MNPETVQQAHDALTSFEEIVQKAEREALNFGNVYKDAQEKARRANEARKLALSQQGESK